MPAPRGRSRAAFPLCFLAGLLLMATGLLGSVAVNAARTELFRNGLERYVAAAGVMSAGDADTFAKETVGYLTGVRAAWAPQVAVNGQQLAVPEAFTAHMAQVKGWMLAAKTALPLAAAAGVALLALCAFTGSKGGRKSLFSSFGYFLGAALPLFAALGLILWSAADFDGFWAWLHYAFIPDGIFYVNEPVMRLFPQALFAGYIAPVAVAAAAGAAAVFLLPAGARRLKRKIKKKAAG